MPYAALKGALATFASTLRRHRKPSDRTAQSAPWKLDIGKWSPELLKQLEWRRLEELCVAYFEALGFATRISHSGTEGGADISLFAEGSEQASIVVQCRAWNAYGIGIKPLLALHALMSASQAGEGVMASSGRFTQEAKAFAAKQHIQLIDGAALLAKIGELPPEKALALLRFATDGDFLTPTCPACAIKMISRQSTQGGRKFWGCRNYPRCKHIIYPTANAPA